MSPRPRLFIGNFDFERTLAVRGRATRPAALERLNRELACAWLAVAEPQDFVWTAGKWDDEFLRRLQADLPWGLPRVLQHLHDAPRDVEVVPWGWSQAVLDDIERAGLPVPPHPPLDIIRYANSRAFSADMERQKDCELPGETLVRTLDDLDGALLRLHAIASNAALLSDPWDDPIAHLSPEEQESRRRDPGPVRWLLKANWSNSSRERLLGQGRELTPAAARWLRTRLARDGVVAFEPWVKIIAEVGVQWEVPPRGRPQLLDIVPMLTDSAGRYRGSDFTPDPNLDHDWRDALYATFDAAERVQNMGYFGPLGIDACVFYTYDGRARIRPLQDINARWTMGRLSLGWRRLLQPLDQGRWLFSSGAGDQRITTGSADLREIAISPAEIDGQPPRIRSRVELRPPVTGSTAPAESAAPR